MPSAHALVGLLAAGVEIVLHGLALGFGQLVEVALGDLLALPHLLAHQLAHFALLVLCQVQVLKHVRGVLAAVMTVVHAARHGESEGRNGSGEQQGYE